MSDSTIPVFLTEEEAVKVFHDLESYMVRLEKDPTVMGPSYVHDKLKACRDYSNKVETLLITYYDKDRRIRNMLGSKKAEYDAKKAEMLATDPAVDKKKSADGRAAYVDYKLKDVIEETTDLKEQLTTCQMLVKAIELRKDGLNRANNDIKKQVSLMEFAHGKSGFLAGDVEEEEGFGMAVDGESGLVEDEAIADLFSAKPSNQPEHVSAELAVHMVGEGDPDPKVDSAQEDVGDLDDFLNNIVTEPAPVDQPAVNEDTSSLEAPSTLDDEEEDLSVLFAQKPAPTLVDQPVVVDEDVVDIGAFLMRG